MKKILLGIFLFSGCSSGPITPLLPPSDERLQLIKASLLSFKAQGESEEVAQAYLRAKRAEASANKKEACDQFDEVSDNEAFPLNQTALVGTLDNCSYSPSKLARLWEKTTPASYVKELYLESSLRLAKELGMEEYVARFSYEMAPYKKTASEKVQLLKKAIELALKLNLKAEEEKYFERLVEVSPLYSKEITKDNIYRVARDFESNRQFEKARDLYLDIINGDTSLSEKVKAYNAYRTSYKVGRNLKMFLEKTAEMELFLRQLLEQSPGETPLEEAWVDSKIAHARAVWTEHFNLEARHILDDVLASNLGNANQLATLYWVYGSLHLESKEYDEALLKYEKAAKFKASPDMQENIQWAIVWNKYQRKKYREVVADVSRFVEKSSNNTFVYKLNFWKAQAEVKLKHPENAELIFSELAKSDPFGYYGILASMQTQSPLPPFLEANTPSNPSGDPPLDWLIAMEEKTLATKRLKEINSKFKTIAEREKVMPLYAETTWYQGGMAQIYSFPLKMRDDLTGKYISIIFPTPYRDLIEKMAQKYNIPPALIYAIIRQESAFNPEARSWADAFGLMQLIPEKAQELARKYRLPYKNYEDLYRPELNIELGAALLGELKQKFSGKFAQNVAAYNANGETIAVWERERFNGDYLEFIEMIPYEETRNYIKVVFRNYVTYQRILSGGDVVVSGEFFSVPY